MKLLVTALIAAAAGAYLCDFYTGMTAAAIVVFVNIFFGTCICGLLLEICAAIRQQDREKKEPDGTKTNEPEGSEQKK